MTAKEFLDQPRKKKKEIAEKKESILRLETLLRTMSVNLSDMPKNPSPSASPMENILCKKYDLETELEEDEKELDILRCEVMLKIEILSKELEKSILINRYLYFRTWKEIAAELSVSLQYVYYLHKTALKHLDETEYKPIKQKIIAGLESD